MINVAVLIRDNGAFFELGCALELFALSRPEFNPWYLCEVVSFTHGPLNMPGGLQLSARQVDSLDEFDMVIVPGWPAAGAELEEQHKDALLRFYSVGKRLLSFCSGAFLLAELGVLDGKQATTHWRYADKFKQRFPTVKYVDDVLYVYDGRIGCSAGSAAAIDLGIEVIRRDFGYRIANQVARRLVMSAHRKGGQSQFVETPVLERADQFSEALDWAIKNIRDTIDINILAEKARMSRRTFDRKFRSTFNMTPNEWLIQQKLNVAKGMLESGVNNPDKHKPGQYNIEMIAEQSGFINAVTMRHHFRKSLGVSPRQYQAQFASG
ncbi:MAG: helix-turn-helix domain-containing protein [Pseudohongiella sp.]|nr:helix-turn-helix domain-containing protein [Pseudohongiella sp.]